MKHYFLFTFLLLMAVFTARAQGLKRLNKGLPGKVLCACSDSLGNVYAVVNSPSDSLVVHQWSPVAQKWQVFASRPKGGHQIFSNRKVTACQMLGNTFFMTVAAGQYIQLYSYSGGSGLWSNNAIIKDNAFNSHSIFRFGQSIYVTGSFDTVGGVRMNNVMAWDKTGGLRNPDFPLAWERGATIIPVSADTLRDTMYMTFQHRILFHKAPNIWGCRDSVKVKSLNFTSVVVKGDTICAIAGLSIYRFKNHRLIDSIRIYGNAGTAMLPTPKGFLLADEFGAVTRSEWSNMPRLIYQNEVYRDSFVHSMLKANNRYFYYGNQGAYFSGDNYNGIVEIDNPDSIAYPQRDTILVAVYRDLNNNGIKDGAERGYLSNISLPGFKSVNTDSFGFYNYTGPDNEKGMFGFLREVLQQSCYEYKLNLPQTSKAFNSLITRDTLFFPLTVSSNSPLLDIRAYNISRARLLDTIQLKCYAVNRSCTTINSATVEVRLHKDFTFVSSSPAFTGKVGNILTFTLSSIPNMGASGEIMVKGYYSNTKYTINDVVKHEVRLLNLPSYDSTGNFDTIAQRMVYSYDPNEKHCQPEGKITYGLNKIKYFIEFQNEGNDDARRVTVVDTLNLKIPVYKYIMLGSSHPYKISNSNNVITWVFDNINLKPKTLNEQASKGFLEFEAHVRSEFRVGDSIRNKAYIYFDYNEPIITKYAVVSRIKEPGNSIDNHYLASATMQLYPNPAGESFSIKNTSSAHKVVNIYSSDGRLVSKVEIASDTEVSVDSRAWASGIYSAVGNNGEVIKFMVQ